MNSADLAVKCSIIPEFREKSSSGSS